ncbi:MAG: hypothetical protein COU71_01770 [Parcubacteria group bacterium CG10_big_fil_rev_8_21_14_0_10_38_31]|nr:MAG: hypothetical protein COU71_01770 [Parcubacteria group bacterium CG10_big_fil_rev_8_21_14_0_10_38_31]
MDEINLRMEGAICIGKTKAVFSTWLPGMVEIFNKDDVTALDGEQKDSFPDKGKLSNQIACDIFWLLKCYGMESHFLDRASGDSFYALECDKIPLEVVVRRVASGSYIKRNPGVEDGVDFDVPVVELFLKDDSCHDPYIDFHSDKMWYLYDSKKPIDTDFFGAEIDPYLNREEVEEVIRQANNIFIFLEWFWHRRGYKLYNFKIEFGRVKEGYKKGLIVWSDVLTPDEWILMKDNVHYDKQPFRDGAPASVLKTLYEQVSKELTEALSKI